MGLGENLLGWIEGTDELVEGRWSRGRKLGLDICGRLGEELRLEGGRELLVEGGVGGDDGLVVVDEDFVFGDEGLYEYDVVDVVFLELWDDFFLGV